MAGRGREYCVVREYSRIGTVWLMKKTELTPDLELAETLIAAAARVERRLDVALSLIRGISYREYQLLAALRARPKHTATRVVLADAMNMTPSGVTRALKPLEKLYFIRSERDTRDARRSLATLTEAGLELLADSDGVINDLFESQPLVVSGSDEQVALRVALAQLR